MAAASPVSVMRRACWVPTAAPAEDGQLGQAQLVADQAGQQVELEFDFRLAFAAGFFRRAHFGLFSVGCGLYSIVLGLNWSKP